MRPTEMRPTEINLTLLLHADLRSLVGSKPTSENLGLLFEKLVADLRKGGWKQGDNVKRKLPGVHKALDHIANTWNDAKCRNAVRGGLSAFVARQSSAAQELAGFLGAAHLTFNAELSSRLAIGMGNASVYENGLTLHHTLGVPYIPGSAIKGIVLNWLWERLEWVELEEKAGISPKGKELPDEVWAVFGKQNHQGLAQFWDALPVSPPRMVVDIMNPHFGDYYQGGKNDPPGDWLDPKPVFFLTAAPGVTFRGHILLRRGRDCSDEESTRRLELLKLWVKGALEDWGAGGKTRSGYGQFKSVGWD